MFFTCLGLDLIGHMGLYLFRFTGWVLPSIKNKNIWKRRRLQEILAADSLSEVLIVLRTQTASKVTENFK